MKTKLLIRFKDQNSILPFFFIFSALCFSNPPSASFCCNVLVWFNFRAYPYTYPCVSRPVMDWVELIVIKFPFHQKWFWAAIQLFDEMRERDMGSVFGFLVWVLVVWQDFRWVFNFLMTISIVRFMWFHGIFI